MGIELTRQDFSAILSMFANADENTEIECKIEAPVIKNGRRVEDGKTIRFDQFQRVLNYASQAFYPQTLNKSEVQLDILHGDNRLTLVGMDNILYFCRHNKIITDHIGGSVFVTQKNRLTKVKLHEYDISVKDSREINLRGDELRRAVEDVLVADRRFYRVKNRYTVVLPTGLRVDFTAVKSSSGSLSSGLSGGLSGQAATLMKNLDNMKNDYEIEIEVLNPARIDKDKPAQQTEMIMNMLNTMSEILLAMEDLDFLMKKSTALRVLQDYTQLVYQKKVYNPYDMPKRWFAGPQPVGIEKENLLEDKEDSPINIHAEYTVTLKADGERHLLYVDGTERAYLINTRLVVIDTGMNIRGYAHSLFDAEVMSPEPPKNGVAQPKDILLFDTYYVKGQSVMHFPLVNLPERPVRPERVKTNAKDDKNPSRIREIEAFLKAPSVSHPYRRRLKQFWWPNPGQPKRIYESVQDAFSKAASQNVDYDLDGVIFTPMYMPVGVDLTLESREQLMEKKPKPGGTWRSVLKWKPPTQNTIDFLVREVPYPIINDEGKKYRRFALFCGQQTSVFENSFSLLKNADSPNAMQSVYARKQFDAPFLKESKDGKGIEEDLTVDTRHMSVELDEKGNARAENGDVIHNDMIVEIYFDMKEKRWRPQRVRHDKLSSNMNSYNTALSVWKTTLDPITKNNVTGIERVNKSMKHDGSLRSGDVDKGNEPYYMESQNRRDQALTYPLKTFHNRWVKEEALISKLKNKGIVKLMDPVVGQGGDLPRYINAGIPVVLGTDLSEKNIYKQDGANDRLLKQMRQGQIKRHWRYVFLPMDFSKPITKTLDNLPARDGENDATLLKLIWGRNTQLPPAVINHPRMSRIRSVKGLAATPFDVINMQFALHYFFESPATIKACLDNINMQLADGGLFIGTCFDGQLVDQMFENNPNSDVLEGRKNGGVIWRIRKKYEGPFDPKTRAGIGKKISVLFETIDVNEKDEYLVGFDYLVNELKKRNIRLLSKTECIEMKLSRYQSHGSFRELFEDMVKRYGHNPMSENNEKTIPQALRPAFSMSEDEKRYSFLNKWFVFKKDIQDD